MFADVSDRSRLLAEGAESQKHDDSYKSNKQFTANGIAEDELDS